MGKEEQKWKFSAHQVGGVPVNTARFSVGTPEDLYSQNNN